MSRRSRRRQAAKSGKSGKSWWLRGVVALMLVGFVVMAGGYAWLKSWMRSEEFRVMLSAQASKALGAEAEFGSFGWDGTVVSSSSFDAEGLGLVKHLTAQGMMLDVGLGKVRERVLVLRDAKLNDLEVVLDLRRGEKVEAIPAVDRPDAVLAVAKVKSPAWYEGLLPNQLELTGLDVGASTVRLLMKDGETLFSGTQWMVVPDQAKGSYVVEGAGGQLIFPWEFLPPLELERAKLRYQDRSVFLTDSRFSLYRRGDLTLVGESSLKGDGFSFEGTLRDVKGIEVLPETWSRRLIGDVESEFTIRDVGQGLAVDGQLRILNGVLTGLPVLDYLGAYGGNPRFRRLPLSVARTDFSWEDGTYVFSDLVLGSEGLMRIEGRIRIDRDERIDGRFRVGLTPGTLSAIPGAETQVFLPGERGLLWAPLHVTGTLDDPKEDLSDRLIEAAGMRMFEILPETGEMVLKFTQQVVQGDLAGTLKTGSDVIRQGTDVLNQGKALLDGGAGGDVVEGARDVIKQGEDVVRGVKGLLDVVRGRGDPTPPPVQEPKEEPPAEDGERDE